MKYLLITIFLFLPFSGKAQNGIIKIDIDDVEVGNIPISKFVSTIEYVPLELTTNSALDEAVVYLTDKYIVTIEMFKKICLFDRKEGHFIRNVSQKGNGPDDYIYPILFNAMDKENNLLFVETWNVWRGIDIETNKCVKEIIKPRSHYSESQKYQNYIRNPYPYGADSYIGFANSGKQSDYYELYVFNSKGVVLKTINNGGEALPWNGRETLSDYGLFQEFEGNLLFKAAAQNDTVYKVTENSLEPSIVLDLHKERVKDAYVGCGDVMQTKRYVFFNCTMHKGESKMFSYCYDKIADKLYACEMSTDHSGFVNDIDGLGTLFMRQLDGNKLVGLLKPEELLEYMATHKDMKLSPRGKKILENLQFDDNPIVVIATLKE